MEQKDVQALIDDALAGAGERFAEQAKTAATETLNELKGKVISFEAAVEALKAAKSPEAQPAEDPSGTETQAAADAAANAEASAKIAADAKIAAVADAAKAAERKAKRAAYLTAKAGKLPAAYQTAIPDTDDEAELDAAVAAGFAALKADAEKGLIRLPDAGAAAGGDAATPSVQTASLAELDRNPAKKSEFIAAHGIKAYLELAAKK